MGKILRKITIKETVGGKMELLEIAKKACPVDKDGKITTTKGPSVKILSVIGHVNSVLAGQSDAGEFAKLKGEFEATNLLTSEVFHCATSILPNFAADPIVNAIKNGAEAVQFAMVFSVNYNETAATMYEFGAESLMPAKRASALEALQAQLATQGIALPAPAAKPLQTVTKHHIDIPVVQQQISDQSSEGSDESVADEGEEAEAEADTAVAGDVVHDHKPSGKKNAGKK